MRAQTKCFSFTYSRDVKLVLVRFYMKLEGGLIAFSQEEAEVEENQKISLASLVCDLCQ